MSKRALAGWRAGALSIGLAAVFAGPAMAGTGDVQFGVNITRLNYCAIQLQDPGAIAPDSSNQVLSSKEAGGKPGKARVSALTNYLVTVDEVPFFLNEPGGMSTGSSFAATFSGSSVFRGLTFNERDGGSGVRLPRGYSVTDLNIDLEITRPAGFAAGDYTALTIVRCE
ncbi:hypothetical protein [Zhengella mangrovi]|uniref:hypothetical protein n=1 Tax=Zhengella mangrovi TaxID=1982044 RepID=UPI00105452C6|nr:hypothetical protein [Zhengella mangrovi]